jgi:DNA phosphorothioation-dependent restriction protein DptG
MYPLKKESIRRFAGKGGKYVFERRKNVCLLPFPTREPERVEFENGFLSVTGAFVRMIKGKSAEIDLKSQSFDDVLRLGKFDDHESKQLFEYYLEESNHDVTSQRIDKI